MVDLDRIGFSLGDLRIWIDLVKEASSIVFVEYTCKAPRLLLERLHVLNFHNKDISRLGAFHFKGARQVVDFCKIDVLHVVGAVIVANLPSCPIYAFHFEDLPVLNFGGEWNCSRSQWQKGRNLGGASCHLDAIYSDKGQRKTDGRLDSSTNVKNGLLIRWLFKVDLDRGAYF